jgi:hypothetical protein
MHHGNLQKNSYAVEIYEMNRTAQKWRRARLRNLHVTNLMFANRS